jgi:hypothetical protein
MRLKEWLYNEIKHILFEDAPLVFRVNGHPVHVDAIDFKWEDFNQAVIGSKQFIQEFPVHVSEPGLVYVNGGYFGEWWFAHLNPAEVQKLRASDKVIADSDTKKLFLSEKPDIGPKNGSLMNLIVNPLDRFIKIPRISIFDMESKQPARFNPPYDRKELLHWWDFVEAHHRNEVVKRPARVRE